MLRARDFDHHLLSDQWTQRRRSRRQRLLETALPCALVAALLITALFTVGHMGHVSKRRDQHARQATQRAQTTAKQMEEQAKKIEAQLRRRKTGPLNGDRPFSLIDSSLMRGA